MENCCEHCGENCLLNFDGNLVLAFGLNNSLKAENKSFDGQDIPLLFEMIDETIQKMLPKERLGIISKTILILSQIILVPYGPYDMAVFCLILYLNRSKLKSLYFIPAIRVEREDWIHSMKCQKAFKIVNKEVESRNHSSISADLAVSIKIFSLS